MSMLTKKQELLSYLLYKVDVMKCPMLKLSTATRKSKVLTSNFHPILVPLDFSKLSVWNIVIPYLQGNNLLFHGRIKFQKLKDNLQAFQCMSTFSLLLGHSIGRLYPSGRGTRQVGGSSGQCLYRCSQCLVLRRLLIAFQLSRHGM